MDNVSINQMREILKKLDALCDSERNRAEVTELISAASYMLEEEYHNKAGIDPKYLTPFSMNGTMMSNSELSLLSRFSDFDTYLCRARMAFAPRKRSIFRNVHINGELISFARSPVSFNILCRDGNIFYQDDPRPIDRFGILKNPSRATFSIGDNVYNNPIDAYGVEFGITSPITFDVFALVDMPISDKTRGERIVFKLLDISVSGYEINEPSNNEE